jgi:hypothetical protein
VAGEERTEKEAVEPQGDEAEMMARLEEEIRNLPVGDHLVYMLHSLSALAVGRLGLTPDTAAQRDLGQAGLAIDAFRALVGVLEQVRPAGEMSVQRGMLSQMQLAFAAATTGAAPAFEPEPQPAEPAEPAEPAAAEAGDPEPKPRKPRRSSSKASE